MKALRIADIDDRTDRWTNSRKSLFQQFYDVIKSRNYYMEFPRHWRIDIPLAPLSSFLPSGTIYRDLITRRLTSLENESV